jgi:hypothetical protein
VGEGGGDKPLTTTILAANAVNQSLANNCQMEDSENEIPVTLFHVID